MANRIENLWGRRGNSFVNSSRFESFYFAVRSDVSVRGVDTRQFRSHRRQFAEVQTQKRLGENNGIIVQILFKREDDDDRWEMCSLAHYLDLNVQFH